MVENRQEKKRQGLYEVKELVCAGICAYLCAACTLPNAGIFYSLPVSAILAVAASFFCKNRLLLCTLIGIVTFILDCFFEVSLLQSAVTGVLCALMAWLGLLIKRAVITAAYSYNKEKSVFTKAIVTAVFSAAALIVVWLFCFGNPVSHIIKQSDNIKYIKGRYGKQVQTINTRYDMFERAYLTKISFDGGDRNADYYVVSGVRDDYLDYCASLLTDQARMYFERMTTLGNDTVYSYIEPGTFDVKLQNNYEDYLEHFEYLLPVTVEINNKGDFESVCENLFTYIKLSDSFIYKDIVIAAVAADETECFAVVRTSDTEFGDIELVYDDAEFSKQISEKYPQAIRK